MQGLFGDGSSAHQIPILNKENIDYEIKKRDPKWAIIADTRTGEIVRHYTKDEVANNTTSE